MFKHYNLSIDFPCHFYWKGFVKNLNTILDEMQAISKAGSGMLKFVEAVMGCQTH